MKGFSAVKNRPEVLAGIVISLIAVGLEACGGGAAEKKAASLEDVDVVSLDGTGELSGRETHEGILDVLDVEFGGDVPIWPDVLVDTEVVDPCLDKPSAFGCPCSDNAECLSGYCVEGPEGSVCTDTCIEECPDGWSCTGMSGFGTDIVFLCVPQSSRLCWPCVADSQCSGGLCLPYAGGRYCTFACENAEDCPNMYACENLEDNGQELHVCLPTSETCDCVPASEGQIRPCSFENEFGICHGYETCDPAQGFVGCTATVPAAEECDGLDNDCNGLFDEELPESMACENQVEGVGTCLGQAACLGTAGWVCDAATPTLETCDFQDNNCDGAIDEDFRENGKYTSLHHCGTCNQDCEGLIANATAQCDGTRPTPLCVVAECEEGFYKLNDFQCMPESQNVCRPCTSDLICEGGPCAPFAFGDYCTETCETDEDCPSFFHCGTVEGLEGLVCIPINGTCDCGEYNAGSTQPCSVTGENGTCTGLQTCDPETGWSECSASEPTPEVCDGLDNDCNGIPDDGLPLAQDCENTNEFGTCTGKASCLGSQGWVCNALVPASESCDYQDNNCDGAADEAFVVDGKYATLHHCGSCNKDCEGALPNAVAYCETSPSLPECRVESCLPGFFELNAYQCILPPNVQCYPCDGDEDCYFDRCVFLDSGNFCLPVCQEGACDAGAHCEELPNVGPVCVPDTQSCDCTPDNAGTVRSCSVSNEAGTCYGVETCEADSGWSACDAHVPVTEDCNGKDDDCDGLIDEGFSNLGTCELTNEFGTCTGTSVCVGALGVICQGFEPQEELCDYQDNNCDGIVDEPFVDANGRYVGLHACGSCNRDCEGALPNATAFCDDSEALPVCKVEVCADGYFALNEFQCILPPDTTCQPCDEDDDCYFDRCVFLDDATYCLAPCTQGTCADGLQCQDVDGQGAVCVPDTLSCACTADNEGAVRSCSLTNDAGTCYGIETCHAASGWSSCDAREPAEESCNGQDDNCNGLIDEGFDSLGSCEIANTFGVCTGVQVCKGTLGLTCEGQTPTQELCDYQDNNCDGVVDESFVDAQGKYVTLHHCGSCNHSCQGALPNATSYCEGSAALPECRVESCDEGYYLLNDYQCIEPPETACKPCNSDSDCYFDRCVPLDNASYCLPECDAGVCASGSHCETLGTYGELCVPDTQTCDCNDANNGAVRSCSQSNDHGTCYGIQSCVAGSGWTDCNALTPGVESCDGVDNDCDGLMDEGFSSLGACELSNAFGTCVGTYVCQGTGGLVCQGAQPAAEVCDYYDNDCDGIVDDGFKNVQGKYFLYEHCGACNHSCEGAIADGSALCDASGTLATCKVDECDDGYFQINEYQCVLPPTTTCQTCTLDSDCYFDSCVAFDQGNYCLSACDSGLCPAGLTCQAIGTQGEFCVPETLSCACGEGNDGAVRSCSTANSDGTCYGVETCSAATGWSECDARVPTPESCDGLDNNCNGLLDEGYENLGACSNTNQFGSCEGVWLCLGSAGLNCQGPVPALDTCDYKDNNCDGLVDEDYRNVDGKYDTVTDCGSCGHSCAGAVPNAVAYCDSVPALPECKVDSCLEGYYQLNEYQCILPPDTSCKPCDTDSDCYFDQCVLLDGSNYCLSACDAGTCDTGFQCETLTEGDFCVPSSGSCSCSIDNQGITRTCSVANTQGTCFGVQACDGASGWGACSAATPVAETCNGADDDCDGSVDEGFTGLGACDITNTYGTCSGTRVCTGVGGIVCQGQTPAEEVCDYVDNNCSGQVDETFKDGAGKYITDEHCGSCNNPCAEAIPNATGECDSSYVIPRCVVASCDSGYYQLSPFQCVIPPDPTCDECTSSSDCYGEPCVTIDGSQRCAKACSSDTDCADGEHHCGSLGGQALCQPVSGSCDCNSTSVGLKRTCSETNSVGTCYGFETCEGITGWGLCTAAIPADEVCDGVDNDCNGSIDDGLPATQACSNTNSFGSCDGLETCVGSAGWVCQAAVPAAESCDYQDNDCDGTVDEDFKTGDKYTDFTHCGSCSISCEGGFPNATAKCDGTKVTPQCVVDTCDSGYFKLNEFQCIPDSASLCEPCVTDDNCVLEGARCVTLSDGNYCSKACESASDCPSGYVCQDYDGTDQCIPSTNSCQCSPANPGLSKSCSVTWPTTPDPGEPYITCYGEQLCEVTGWSACQLDAELCDGQDNDCNGVIDDGFLVGGKYTADENCGQCGNNCTFLPIADGYGYCDDSLTVPACTYTCDLGFYDVNQNQGDGCECEWTSTTDVPDGTDQNCDGVDGEILNAIFVAKNGSDSNPGTIAQPMLTIEAAMTRAASTSKRDVYVATGVYAQSITLVSGVRVYGGYSSTFLERDIDLNITVIMGQAYSTSKPGAVNAISLTGTQGSTVLDGFAIYGKNNSSAGGSSYAVYVRNCTNALQFSHNTVEAGVGGNGLRGSDGTTGTNGNPGSAGLAAQGYDSRTCSPFPRTGAAPGSRTCGSTNVSGGAGGDNLCPEPFDRPPASAENGDGGQGPSAGGGGTGGYAREIWVWCAECHQSTGNESGEDGEPGADGSNGNTALGNSCSDNNGSVVAGYWTAGTSSYGQNGGPGSGGGGGGAGGGAMGSSAWIGGCDQTHMGASGGGGGSGACGGTGGSGGGGGGGSFGLFLSFGSTPTSVPSIQYNVIYGGIGGSGGTGGNGGTGGTAGQGGSGGLQNVAEALCGSKAGSGGDGGNGGHGEGGGGGCGGVSYCIFADGYGSVSLADYKKAFDLGGNEFYAGSGGQGGNGGPSIGNEGDDGANGASGSTNF